MVYMIEIFDVQWVQSRNHSSY